MNPRKYSPKAMTTRPHTTFTAVWYSMKNAPTVEASAPMPTNTQVKPSTKPSALRSTTEVRTSSPAAK